jgi:mRNA interferase MazF
MAGRINRGEIWLYSFKRPNKRRPVLVLTRQEVIRLLTTVMVAPITSTIRGAPSEVVVGVDEGLKRDSAVNLDHVQTVEKARLRTIVGSLSHHRMRQVCKALATAAGCASPTSLDPEPRAVE